MQNHLILQEQTKEELIRIILEKQREIERLKAELEKKNALDEHKRFMLLERLAKRKIRPQDPGQKVGHVGITRQKPAQIDRVIEQTLKHCPDCNQKLSRSQEVVEHIQEDLIPARPQATCFRKHRYYCKCCEKLVTAPCATDEIPNSYVGPHVLIQALILKYHHGLPFNKIKDVFKNLNHFEISEGALSQALIRMSEWLKVEQSEILSGIRASPQIHVDETGWKISGTKHWLWAAVNKRLAYYRIAVSRGARVAREIVGTSYSGILSTDFYQAYDCLPGRKQKCLVHLLRTMREYRFKDNTAEFVKYERSLNRIIRDAIRLQERHERLGAQIYKRRVKRITTRLLAWSSGDYQNKNLIRLAKRFLKHGVSLLTFLENPKIDYHNNLAERMIRPNVIIRNRSFQNRSQKGAEAHGTHMSLIQTLRLQGRDIFTELKQAYLSHRQGNTTPILSVASFR